MTVYIDLNIFDRLEKFDKIPEIDKPNYQLLLTLLTDKKITTAYSTAHLNDLLSGFQKILITLVPKFKRHFIHTN